MTTGALFQATDLPRPLVVAPMAGGPSTPAMTVAAASAGGMGLLAAGYKTPELLAEQVAAVRAGVTGPFGVNLFVPGPPADLDAAAAYRESLLPLAECLGVDLPEPRQDDDAWDAKLDLLSDEPVPVVSFTFGCPPADAVARLHAVGTACWATITSGAEARQAEAAGADALVVQGPGAGGHRAVFDPTAPAPRTPLAELVEEVRAVSALPLVVAGGLTSPEEVQRWTQAGFTVAAGTAFLDAAEAGTSPVIRAALHDERFTDTALTRAFSGRLARGLVNDFMRAHDEAPASYPAVNQVTGPIRGAGFHTGDAQVVSLWAGTSWRESRPGTAAEVYDRLLG